MNPYLLIGALSLGLFLGSTTMGWYRDSAEKALMDIAEIERDQAALEAATIIQDVMDEKAKIRIKWRTKYEKVYIDMPNDTKCLDDAGLQLWNEANIAAKANSPDGRVPTVAVAH